MAISTLIGNCPPLDVNSDYAVLVQCDHFSETCCVAERDGKIVGWISGHIIPGDTPELFIWQVAVCETARGEGLARRMLDDILAREICADVSGLKTTITADNDGSWSLFESLARRFDADLTHAPHYKKATHFDGNHDTEHLVNIDLSDVDNDAIDAAA